MSQTFSITKQKFWIVCKLRKLSANQSYPTAWSIFSSTSSRQPPTVFFELKTYLPQLSSLSAAILSIHAFSFCLSSPDQQALATPAFVRKLSDNSGVMYSMFIR